LDKYIYTDSIVKSVLKTWNCTKIQREKIEIKTTTKKWIIPINIIRVDIERGLDWLRDYYCKDGKRHYWIITDRFLEEIRKIDIQKKYRITPAEYYQIEKVSIGVITEFLNGEW
jgi:hypothetical protein